MPERVRTDEAPSLELFRSPLLQAVIHGDTIHVFGQMGIDPESGEMVEGGIESETRQALENIGAVLAAASFDDVTTATVFVTIWMLSIR